MPIGPKGERRPVDQGDERRSRNLHLYGERTKACIGDPKMMAALSIPNEA
jgi:hypothetical protein